MPVDALKPRAGLGIDHRLMKGQRRIRRRTLSAAVSGMGFWTMGSQDCKKDYCGRQVAADPRYHGLMSKRCLRVLWFVVSQLSRIERKEA